MPKVVLTPEEKKALKIKKKADKKLLAELKKKEQQYDKLGRELKYGQLTLKRHEKSWRQMLIKIALPNMRSELTYAWHNFERVLDSKDFTISLLLDELECSEQQYMRSMRSHMDNIDNLIVLCYDQIAGLREESQQVIQNLYKAATYERIDVINITKDNEEYLRTMLYMLDDQKKESEKMLRGEYLSKQEVEISRLQEVCNKFTEDLETKFNTMWDDSIKFLKQHIAKCSTRRKEYYQLTKQDQASQELIRRLWNRIRLDMDSMKIARIKFNQHCYEENKKIKNLSDEWEHFDHVYKTLKKRVEEEATADDANLLFLTITSNAIIKQMKSFEKKSDQLLHMAAICRKFETMQEKTLPFPTFYTHHTVKNRHIKIKDPDFVCPDYKPEMVMFWNRVGQVDSLRYKYNEELEYLRLKNISLKQNVHQYCMCLSCDETINVAQS